MPVQETTPAHQMAGSRLEGSLGLPTFSPRQCGARLAAARLLILKVLKNGVRTLRQPR